MKELLIILIMGAILTGCSSTGAIMPACSDGGVWGDNVTLTNSRSWTWDIGLYKVSEDHSKIDGLPIHGCTLHYNLNSFVEPPACKSCLMIGKPQVQPDGTIKVKVMLTHPFPGQPEYTGFDVRGVIMFPATRYWEYTGTPYGLGTKYEPICYPVPVNFSLAQDGGAQLLNPDGYTIYFYPGFDLGEAFDQPVFKYSKGKYAYGPDPDSTINAFKLFTNDPERRMFRTTDAISRTYHIDPPDGEFAFGYVIDASWAPPTKTPVTDPKNDFPFWANCEEGYVLKTEQLQPFKTGGVHQSGDLSETTFLLSPYNWYLEKFPGVLSFVLCPDIAPIPELKTEGLNWGFQPKKVAPGVYATTHVFANMYFYAPPGDYPAVIVSAWLPYPHPWPDQLNYRWLFDLITLEVVQGD